MNLEEFSAYFWTKKLANPKKKVADGTHYVAFCKWHTLSFRPRRKSLKKISPLDLRRFKPIPDLPSRISCIYSGGFRLFLPLLQLNHLSTCYPPLFSKLRQNTQGMAVFSQRGVDHDVRATLRFFSKVEFFPFFQSWFKRSLMGSDGFWWVLMGFDGFWWVLMGSISPPQWTPLKR